MSTPTDLPKPQTPERLRWLAEHFVGKRVVAADDVPEDLLTMVFMPIGFGALEDYTREQLGELTLFAIDGEDKTTGMAVNGWPMFVSCHVWRRSDVLAAWDLAKRAREAMG